MTIQAVVITYIPSNSYHDIEFENITTQLDVPIYLPWGVSISPKSMGPYVFTLGGVHQPKSMSLFIYHEGVHPPKSMRHVDLPWRGVHPTNSIN